MNRIKIALVLVFLAMTTQVQTAYADCYFGGARFSNGARHNGQMCMGESWV